MNYGLFVSQRMCSRYLFEMPFFRSGDTIMTGEGHKDWLSDCDFHPGYDPSLCVWTPFFLRSIK